MFHAFANVGLMLLIGQRAETLANRMEIVRFHILTVDRTIELFDACLAFSLQSIIRRRNWSIEQGNKLDGIVKMVEHDEVAIEDIENIGSVILCHRGIFDLDILKISHGIKGGITIKSTEIRTFTLYVKTR